MLFPTPTSSTPTTTAIQNVDTQLSCISSQLSYLADEVGELLNTVLLAQSVATGTLCANQVNTQYGYYSGLVANAMPNADGSPSAYPLDSTNQSLVADVPAWGPDGVLTGDCGSSINSMLFFSSTPGVKASWQQLNTNFQSPEAGGSAWYTQLQAQQLQQFLSYWSTLLYDQFVLQNEYFNYNGLIDDANILAGNVSGTSYCTAGSSSTTTQSYCVWTSNIQNAYPGDLYSDEIGIPSSGLAVNAYPAGLALGLGQQTINPQYLLPLGTFSSTAAASDAFSAFNNQGINPALFHFEWNWV
jgi:hypothetical protein